VHDLGGEPDRRPIRGELGVEIAARLGVDRKETMAIGDNWNDVDMLEWAGQAVMMSNAAQDLRTMAKTRGWKQTAPNDEDGVAVTLEMAMARRSSATV